MSKPIQPFYRSSGKKVSVKGMVATGKAGKMEYRQPPLNQTFGNVRYYLIDPVQAAALHDLTGTKTLLPMHLNALAALGFDLIEVQSEE